MQLIYNWINIVFWESDFLIWWIYWLAVSEEHQDANSAAARTMSDTEISDIVDMVLKEDDLNNDGYVEYSEFATAQRRAKTNIAKN